jgi:dTDP-4-dehydrorhamnose reductase
MIHVSTDFVFDGTKNEPYLESDPRNPISWYGTTKAMAEETVEKSGVKYAIARLSYPYRANFDQKPDLIKKIREALETGTLTPRFSDTLITPTFVDDIAKGFAKLATLQTEGIYHLVGTGSISPYELARVVAEAYDLDQSQVIASTLVDYQKNSGGSFVKNGALSNKVTKDVLDIDMVDLITGLGIIKAQQK